MKDLKKFVAKQQNVFANDLTEFLAEAKLQGFHTLYPEGSDNPVHESKAGNPQIAMDNDEGERLYLRISEKLDAALREGEDNVNLLESPIYETALTGDRAGSFMLVIGMKAENTMKRRPDIKNMKKWAVSKEKVTA
jgi:hypothetical protein